YLVVPVGIEFKLTTFLRLQYRIDSNILLGSNASVEEYMEYGKKAISPVMFTNHAAILLHGGNAFGISMGATFNPTMIRNDLNYTYDYMKEWQGSLKNSYLITFGLWADASFKPRKKI